MKKIFAAAAMAAALACSAPASAQDSAYELGSLWNVGMIDVEDGQFEAYMDWLNSRWKSNQRFAKSQGWLLDFHILANENSRYGEPDLYLITVYAEMPTPAKEKKMNDEFVAMMQRDEHKLDAESGVRTKMRTVMGGMLLRELTLRK